jgi:hypothetical protein
VKVTRAGDKTQPGDEAEARYNTKPSGPAKVPHSCSDVFRLWVSVGLGLIVGLAFEIMVIVLQVTQTRPTPTEAEFELEFLFGARLTAWKWVRDCVSRTRAARLLPLRSSRAGTTGAGKAAPDVPGQEVVARWRRRSRLAGRYRTSRVRDDCHSSAQS